MSPIPTVRIDYEPDDPDAPVPTSRIPGAAVVAVDGDGRVLVIQRSDSGRWDLPGGTHDLGESLPHTATRECLEETGVAVAIDGLVGTFTNPRQVFEYRGERPEIRHEFSVLFTGRAVGGEPTASEESRQVRWVTEDELDRLDMTSLTRLRIAAWREHRRTGACHIG